MDELTLTFTVGDNSRLDFTSNFGLRGELKPAFAVPYWLTSHCCSFALKLPPEDYRGPLKCGRCGKVTGLLDEWGVPWFREDELPRLERWLERYLGPLESVVVVPKLVELLSEVVRYGQSRDWQAPVEEKRAELEELARAYSGPIFAV